MSFDLTVLAIDPDATDEQVRSMVERCLSDRHPEGDLDERIVAFYEQLRARFPDYPPGDDESPWMSMPLDVGVDHVQMTMSFSRRSDPAIDYILELAQRHGLTIHDPQGDEVIRPTH